MSDQDTKTGGDSGILLRISIDILSVVFVRVAIGDAKRELGIHDPC